MAVSLRYCEFDEERSCNIEEEERCSLEEQLWCILEEQDDVAGVVREELADGVCVVGCTQTQTPPVSCRWRRCVVNVLWGDT